MDDVQPHTTIKINKPEQATTRNDKTETPCRSVIDKKHWRNKRRREDIEGGFHDRRDRSKGHSKSAYTLCSGVGRPSAINKPLPSHAYPDPRLRLFTSWTFHLLGQTTTWWNKHSFFHYRCPSHHQIHRFRWVQIPWFPQAHCHKHLSIELFVLPLDHDYLFHLH